MGVPDGTMLVGMERVSGRRGGGWLWGAVACIIIFASVVALSTFSPSLKVTVMLGADGQARLFGVPLGHGAFRRSVFFVLFRGTRAEIALGVPPNVNFT